MTVLIWSLVLGTIAYVGRIDDSDYHDPEDHISELERFSPAPADLPKGIDNSN